MKVLTTDILKGAIVALTGDRIAKVVDGKKACFVRMVEVLEGGVNEMGSVYVFDFMRVQINGAWYEVELTPRQARKAEETKAALTDLGFF